MKLFRSYILLLMVVLGCSYNPGDEYFDDFEPITDQPILTYNLSLKEDTFQLLKTTLLQFDFDLENKELLNSVAYVDGLVIDSAHKYNFDLYLDPKDFGNGYHVLEFKIYTETGTGSLADELGVEFFSVDIGKWWFFVDNSVPPKTKIISAQPENGYLRIDFEEYAGSSFISYSAYKNEHYSLPFFESSDPKHTYFIDSFYIGEGAKYRVDARNINQVRDGFLKILPTDPGIELSEVENVGDALFKISWTKPPYYANVRNYEVHPLGSDTIYSTRDVLDTTVLVKRFFGFGSEYRIVMLAKESYYFNGILLIDELVKIPSYGEPAFISDWARLNSTLNVMYTESYENSRYTVKSYDLNEKEIAAIHLGRHVEQYAMNNEYLFTAGYLWLLMSDAISFESLDTMKKEVVLADWDQGGDNYFFGSVLAAGNELVAIDLSKSFSNNSSEGHIVVDINSQVIIDSLMSRNSSDYVAAFKHYYLCHGDVFSYEKGERELIGHVDVPSFSRFNFLEIDDRIYLRQTFRELDNDNLVTVRVFNFPNFSLLNQVTFQNSSGSLVFDSEHLNFGVYNGQSLRVVDFYSGEVIRDIPVNCDVKLSNGYLICEASEIKIPVY